jgi:uncharacterized Zn-finger protein
MNETKLTSFYVCVTDIHCSADGVIHEPDGNHIQLYSCFLCDKKLLTCAMLQEHLLCHEMPCDVQSGNQTMHSKFIPPNVRECNPDKLTIRPVEPGQLHNLACSAPPHKCPDCGKTYLRQESLSVHVKVHSSCNPNVCSECGKAFGDSAKLKLHIRLHTGEKPYKCNTCDKCFSRYNSLKAHRIVHTGEKIYQCTGCEKVFARPSDLRHFTLASSRLNVRNAERDLPV